MAIKPLARKVLKITGIAVGVLLVLLVVAYFWFIHHAESIIREIVHHKSKGKVALSLKNIVFNFSDRRLDLKHAILYNTDSASKKTTYHVSVEKLSLQLHALMPLVLHRELIIDSILIANPDIRVMKSDTLEKRQGSLSREIGDLYHSIHKALSLFSVGYFRVSNGQFTLANRAREDWQPVTISNIDFLINNFEVDGKRAEDKPFLFSDNIIFSTHDQAFTFPDGRYRMTFRRFHINVKDRVIALDSCTLISAGRHHKKVAVNLFFDKLQFANIDFTDLYATNTIRADSMYATNPVLNLRVQPDSTQKSNAPPVHMDTLLHHLGLDMQLKYMGVKNISTSVVTHHGEQTAEFRTKGDDFEMRDLMINRNAPQPVTVGRFDMAIRGYSSLNRDSTYSFKFDSVRIINSSILLNNFSITSLAGAPVKRHHQLPLFELDSLSWEELIFNRHIKAKQAVLYEPEIHYTKLNHTKNGSKVSMYSMLNSLDNAMSLERIRVINGNVSYAPNPDTRLLLQQVNLTVSTNRLLAARTSSMMGDAVDWLHFERGSIKTKKLQAYIRNGSFTGDSTILEADEAAIHDLSGRMAIRARGIRLSGLVFDDSNDHITIGSARWREAQVSIHTATPPATPSHSSSLSLNVEQVHGNNTHFLMTGPHNDVSTFITSLKIDAAKKDAGKVARFEGLAVRGKQLQFAGKNMALKAGVYELTDMHHSFIHDVHVTHYTTHDSITAVIPQMHLVPGMAAIAAGSLQAEELTLKAPTFLISLTGGKSVQHQQPGTKESLSSEGLPRERKPLPAIHIKKLAIEQPTLHFEQRQVSKDSFGEKRAVLLTWNPGTHPARNQWLLTNIRHDGKAPLTIGKVHLSGTDVSFTRQADKPLFLQPQSIELILDNISLATGKHHSTPWSAMIEHFALSNMKVSGLGKDSSELYLKALSLEHLAVQAQQHHSEWLNNSPHFHLKELSGTFTSSKDHFFWQQLRYQHPLHLLSIDSFAYTPVQDRNTYIATHPYQTDYIQLQTGKITVQHPNLPGYFKDTLAHIATVHIHQPTISVYRDKRPPREPNVIRPLPVTAIKNLALKLRVDSVLVHNGHVRYEELSEKTGKSGIISISQLNASLATIKSYDHHHTDSLKLHADAYLIDSIRVNLRLYESYTDTLAAFHMTTRISKANLVHLNKVIEPLASVRIRSGHLDSLTLRAIGRENLSYGEMHMMYRKLNVQILKGGDEQKKGFVTKLITFVANSFVIKNRNQRQTGIIYFERLRDRSIFNYMIKMLLSGAGSSVGAKSNKKYIRHYKRELRRQQLPPIHLQ
jgi:hypothetical protein